MKQKFEIFFESGESILVKARSESEAMQIAMDMRPNDVVAFAHTPDLEQVAA